MTATRLRRCLQTFAKKRPNFQIFRSSESTRLWKIAYFSVAAFLFVSSAHKRFSLPQYPLADSDVGFLWPALMKLSGGAFKHIQGLNFLYPGMVYLALRIWADFRAISVIQHLLGLIAGVLFLASWSRLADFFPKPRLNRVGHEAIGLVGASIYLLSYGSVFFEMRIRSDAVCMFFQMLVLWFVVEFFYRRVVFVNLRMATLYGTGVAISSFVLASLKPSFTLVALFVMAPVMSLTLSAKKNFTGKLTFFSVSVPIILALTLTEHFLRRDDQSVKYFLPETLFAIHAKIIHAQMDDDLNKGDTNIYPREWLQIVCDDLGTQIQRTHGALPVLGFDPDSLMSTGADPLLKRWRSQLGDDQFLRFLKYWYWRSVAHRPLAFAGKITRQLGVFYSTDCPAFSVHKKFRLTPWSYDYSLSALSHPQTWALLTVVPGGSAFVERTKALCSSDTVIRQKRSIRMCNIFCARSYLAILLVSVPLAVWFVFKRNNSEQRKLPAFFVLLFYTANFGNVFGVSIVHTMEVDRYVAVLFITALFAHLWAIRWLVELGLAKRASLMPADTLYYNPTSEHREDS